MECNYISGVGSISTSILSNFSSLGTGFFNLAAVSLIFDSCAFNSSNFPHFASWALISALDILVCQTKNIYILVSLILDTVKYRNTHVDIQIQIFFFLSKIHCFIKHNAKIIPNWLIAMALFHTFFHQNTKIILFNTFYLTSHHNTSLHLSLEILISVDGKCREDVLLMQHIITN